MVRKHGPWTIHETERKYQNSFIDVREDRVLQPNGEPGMYATVDMKPGVAVLAVDRDRVCYLIRHFRYALGRESLEVACGAIEQNDPPLETAQRELREELGIEAEEWIDLGFFDLDTSIVRCSVYLFLAKGLTFTKTEREGTETMKTVKMSLDEAVQKVMDSTITHGPSCLSIFKAYLATLM